MTNDKNRSQGKGIVKNKSDSKGLRPFLHQGSRLRKPQLWAAILIPWTLDLISPHLFLTTIVGAAIWYLLIAATILKQSAKDHTLRHVARYAVVVLWLTWGLAYLGNVLLSSSAGFSDLSEAKQVAWIQSWLIRFHATLFAGSAGLVLLAAVSSTAWIIQMKRVRAQSWERRRYGWLKLPSLESLQNLSVSSTKWAALGWGAGLSLAMISLLITGNFHFTALFDAQLIFSLGLWSLLLFGLVLAQRSSIGENRLQWTLFISNSFFWALLLLHAFSTHYMSFHEPIRWWTR